MEDGPQRTAEIDPMMLIEAVVLDRDDGLPQFLRDSVQWDGGPVFPVETGDQLVVGAVDTRRLIGRRIQARDVRQPAVECQRHTRHHTGPRDHQREEHREGDQSDAHPSHAVRRQLRSPPWSPGADRLQSLAVDLHRGLPRSLGLLPHPLGMFSRLAAPVVHQTGLIVPRYPGGTPRRRH